MADLIERQEAIIELVFNEETKDIKCEDMRKVLNVLNKLPSASAELSNNSPKLDNENGELISRQDAIDTLLAGKEFLMRALDDTDVVCQDREKYSWGLGLIESCINDIEELSSAEPRKKGKWIYYDPNGFKCSRCGSYLEIGCGDVKMNFCPNCGADMRGEQSETD